MAAVRKNSNALTYLDLKSDYDIVMEAAQQDGYMLRAASEELRANYEVVLAAVKRHGDALQYASAELRGNVGMVMEARCLEHASLEIRADRATVMNLIQSYGASLRWASDDLKADYGIFLAALKQDAYAFAYASDELQADRSLILEALESETAARGLASGLCSHLIRNTTDVTIWRKPEVRVNIGDARADECEQKHKMQLDETAKKEAFKAKLEGDDWQPDIGAMFDFGDDY